MLIPTMPEEYRGKTTKSGGYTNTAPRKWTKKEIEWALKLKNDGYNNAQIAESMGRSNISVQIKLKRLGKKDNTYNAKHVLEKYEINQKFLNEIKPENVLDVYVGERDFYKNYKRITNDKNENIPADYHLDAHKLLCYLYWQSEKFDLIDLYPFGSAYDCFDLAIKMAQKGLVITLGELGHKRWKRLDYVSTHYDINSLDDFTIENLISYIQKIGRQNKKDLVVFDYREWRNIGRVWFKIEPLKITSQWEKETNVSERGKYEAERYDLFAV
jgi:hypothetical protein